MLPATLGWRELNKKTSTAGRLGNCNIVMAINVTPVTAANPGHCKSGGLASQNWLKPVTHILYREDSNKWTNVQHCFELCLQTFFGARDQFLSEALCVVGRIPGVPVLIRGEGNRKCVPCILTRTLASRKKRPACHIWTKCMQSWRQWDTMGVVWGGAPGCWSSKRRVGSGRWEVQGPTVWSFFFLRPPIW